MSKLKELESWPELPLNLRPTNLYISENITKDLKVRLERIGWRVVDVRLMPAATDWDRAEALKARLEGIRQGSIDERSAPVRHLELEARCYGLLDKKKESLEDPEIEEETLDQLLNFSSKRADGKVEVKVKRRPGRPKKEKNVRLRQA